MDKERLIEICNPKFYYPGKYFGYSHTARLCKICNSDKRDVTEMLLRNPEVRYSEIIQMDDESVEPLDLNKTNLSIHKNSHLEVNLVLVKTLPDLAGRGILVAQDWLDQTPHFSKDGDFFISQCSLGYCGCDYLESKGKKYLCSYQGECPQKGDGGDSNGK